MTPEASVRNTDYLAQAIGAMLAVGMIRFEGHGWCFSMVDVSITSEVFTGKEILCSVPEDDWNDGPSCAVANVLAQAIRDGELKFVPSPLPLEEK